MAKSDDIRFSKNVSSYVSLIVIGIFALIIIIGVIVAYNYFSSATEAKDPDSTDTVEVSIEPDAGGSEVGTILENEGIIDNGTMFNIYLTLNSITEYQAGDYELSPSMNFEQIARTLETGSVYQEVLHRVTIPEGYSIEQIAEQLEQDASISESLFLDMMTDEEFINELIDEYPDMLSDEILDEDVKYPLEGYLYPATYEIVEEDPSVESIVRQMLDATQANSFQDFNEVDDYEITYEGEDESQSFHDFLTFSSLIEMEATSLADRSMIASVFYNRLEAEPEMPLQTDPSVLYALGEHQERTLFEDLEVEDPYNTYLNEGLPPGPISSPGAESVQSTLNPSDTDYYYFLADSEGNNHYAETFEEHAENREEYIDDEE